MDDLQPIPKISGGDIELSGFLTGSGATGDTGMAAARLLLSRIEGYPRNDRLTVLPTVSGTDLGRRFLSTGDCAYIDCSKLEIALREVTSARDWVAAWEAMLGVVRRAQREINNVLPSGCRLHVHANNSDGENSWGAHIDMLCSRREFENIVQLGQPAHMLSLASFLASGIVLHGQGHVGASRDRRAVDFQLSQRADHLDCLLGPSTMSPCRSFVNTRDESHGLADQARLHVIPCDANRQQTANYLKIGTLQIALYMLEAGEVDTTLLLEDPLSAIAEFSRDPLLETRARMLNGRSMTALELQLRFAENAARFVETGACEGVVPEAGEIVTCWRDVLLALRAGEPVTDRLDWPLKLSLIQRSMERDSRLTWTSPEVRRLDHVYSSLDERDGLYQAIQRAGGVRAICSGEEISRAASDPPEDTRAYTRARLLRLAQPEEVLSMDWSWLRFRIRGRSYWPTYRSVHISNPAGHTRAETGLVLESAAGLEEALDGLDELCPPSPSENANVSPYRHEKGEREYGASQTN
jgi:proteasome accessory factor A